MAAKVNLIRDARVFFTTNVDPITGVVSNGSADAANPAFSTTNTFELQVLDGLSFSQNTTTETVTMNESGTAPVRGQRVFNSALEAADFSFSTYLKPALNGTTITCEERHLWAALSSKVAANGTDSGWADGSTSGTPAPATADFANSDQNQLLKFGIIICTKGNTIVMNNCALESANIDFGIDQIAMAAWAGKATTIEYRDPVTFGALTDTSQAITGGLGTGTATYKITENCAYLANKLSVVTITYGIANDQYVIPVTGGSLSIANNITYLTPATVGVVNKPITYFTGTRAISGSLSAYLRASGTALETGDLLEALQTAALTTDKLEAEISVRLGGTTAAPNVEFLLPTAMLSIPDVTTDQIVGMTLNFTGQGSTDITDTDELTVNYNYPAA